MSIPTDITRNHVLDAMAQIRRDGVPADRQSSKFDVLDNEGRKYPPKLVVQVAAELATGNPLSHRDFSGGEETNRVLRNLGFEIARKTTAPEGPQTIAELAAGTILSNDQLTDLFEVGNAGGMRWSSRHGHLVIVADHTKTLYDDRWENNILRYTGMGRLGDQTLTGQNRRLATQGETGIAVYLFEVFRKNRYQFAGTVTLAGETRTEDQLDDDGNLRKVFVFPLELADGASPPRPARKDLEDIRGQRQTRLGNRSTDELKELADRGGKQTPGRRETISTYIERDEAVVAYVKRKAAGHCDLCGRPAPFESRNGPYLECHHVEHLAKGGADTKENAVALCPNCHRKMHVVDRSPDRARLRRRIRERDSRSDVLTTTPPTTKSPTR